MNKNQFDKLGWVFATCVATTYLLTGFQAQSDKVSYVDVTSIIQNSDAVKKNDEILTAIYNDRVGLLNFVAQNPAIATEKVTRLKDLWLTQNPTEPQKAELEKLKTEALADTKRASDLVSKEPKTPAEQNQLQEFVRRKEYIEQKLVNQWQSEFEEKLRTMRAEMDTSLRTKARSAVTAAARASGSSIVFASPSALYGANDLTEEASKVLNQK